MGFHYQRKPARIGRRSKATTGDDWQAAKSPGSLAQLQHTIGNHTLSRMLQRAPDTTRATPADSKNTLHKSAEPATFYVASLHKVPQGDIPGYSKLEGHEGKLEFQSVSYEFPEDNKRLIVHVTTPVDNSTPIFQQMHMKGDHIAGQMLILRRQGHGELGTFKTMDFIDGLIESMTMSGGDVPLVSISFNFLLRNKIQ